MKTKMLLMLGALTFFINCKQNREAEKPKVLDPTGQTEVSEKPTAEIMELLKFADTALTISGTVDDLLMFKIINGNDSMETVNSKEAVDLYKSKMKARDGNKIPVFDIKNTNKAILVFGNKGYEGPIWAKVLVDKKAREILKIEFGHQFESEGYGDGIKRSSFEQQFFGASYDTKDNIFGLLQGSKEVMKGTRKVDGISGATITSTKAVQMVNEGLQSYLQYAADGN